MTAPVPPRPSPEPSTEAMIAALRVSNCEYAGHTGLAKDGIHGDYPCEECARRLLRAAYAVDFPAEVEQESGDRPDLITNLRDQVAALQRQLDILTEENKALRIFQTGESSRA